MSADEWNSKHPVGTPVRYWPFFGGRDFIDTKTRSQAWTLGSGHHVVSIAGKAGGVQLTHIEAIEEGSADK